MVMVFPEKGILKPQLLTYLIPTIAVRSRYNYPYFTDKLTEAWRGSRARETVKPRQVAPGLGCSPPHGTASDCPACWLEASAQVPKARMSPPASPSGCVCNQEAVLPLSRAPSLAPPDKVCGEFLAHLPPAMWQSSTGSASFLCLLRHLCKMS